MTIEEFNQTGFGPRMFATYRGGVLPIIDAICRKCGKNMGFIGTWRKACAGLTGIDRGE
jgi:hypothetical protein